MRVVYNTDDHGAPINQIGALQFLLVQVDDITEDEEISYKRKVDVLRRSQSFSSDVKPVQRVHRTLDHGMLQRGASCHNLLKIGRAGINAAPSTLSRVGRPPVNIRQQIAPLPSGSDDEHACSNNSAEDLLHLDEFLNNSLIGHDTLFDGFEDELIPDSPRVKRHRSSPDKEVSSLLKPSSSRSSSFRSASPPDEIDESTLEATREQAVAHMVAFTSVNSEPVCQASGKGQPSGKPYEQLDATQVASDAGETKDIEALVYKLETSATSGRPAEIPLSPQEICAKEISLTQEPMPLEPGRDILEQPTWGFDSYTQRNFMEVLSMCPGFEHNSNPTSPESLAERRFFIERRLLPAIQLAGRDGCNLPKVMEGLRHSAEEAGNAELASACKVLSSIILSMVSQEKRGRGSSASNDGTPCSCPQFRVRPKGTGVVCTRPAGLPSGHFVASFVGEAYAPWRWFEKQDALRRKHGNLSAEEQHMAVPLERPSHLDDLGYDVVFIDSKSKASIGSRIAHSCKPNCSAVTMCMDGQVGLGIFTLRKIDEGEELTWDHARVTELEAEQRASVCLCGASSCRGSALYYVNSKSFFEVMGKQHAFLNRTAMLLCACTDAVGQEDMQRLQRSGVGKSILTDDPAGLGVPLSWMAKWASLLLKYIEQEAAILPQALMARDKVNDEESVKRAMIETEAICANRRQNLAVTLDKAKYFLRKQPEDCRGAPLRMLSDTEVIKHLWTGNNSIARRFVTACAEGLQHSVNGDSVLKRLKELLSRQPTTPDSCRHLLRELAATMGSVGPSHFAAHDCALLYANTEHFFEPSKYHAVTTCHLEATEGSDTASPHKGAPKKSKGGGKKGADSDGACKKYRPGFLWGQMSAWYKQTVRDPSASLSADRRGTVSLPDPECCMGKEVSSGKYGPKDRRALISHIENSPSVMWPLQTIWSFKNPSKVYGSPMLDTAIKQLRGDPEYRKAFDDLLQEFKNTL